MTSLRFAIVGAGRVGTSLALALQAENLRMVGYTTATPAGGLRAQALLGGEPSTSLADLAAQDADLYFITVPDSALPEVSAELGELLRSSRDVWVAHTSGVTSVSVLEPCALAGATIFKLHPLQTFPDPALATERFAESAMAITPGVGTQDSPGARMGFALAHLLHARPFLLSDEHRALYHAAATIACNYFVTLEHLARGLFVKAGLPAEEALSMFLPLVSTTLDNLQEKGPVGALTGPLSRGDTQTVREHLATLSTHAPSLLALYAQLGLATLDVVRERGDMEEECINELAGLLRYANGNHTDT